MNLRLTCRKALLPLVAANFFIAASLCVAQQATTEDTGVSTSLASVVDDNAALPQAPTPQNTSAQPQGEEHTDGQTSRILGILPNFRAVSADQHLPPQSVKEKFVTATEDSFDYSSLFAPTLVATISYERNSVPEFGSGGVAYGRYIWHAAVDQTIENYMVEFVVPSITHEDTRYYTLGHGGFGKRFGYAVSRIVVTRSDSGHPTFNASEVIGAGAAAGISNLYYPTAERSVGNTMTSWATSLTVDAAGFFIKEFWPDINHALFHGNKPFNSGSSH